MQTHRGAGDLLFTEPMPYSPKRIHYRNRKLINPIHQPTSTNKNPQQNPPKAFWRV